MPVVGDSALPHVTYTSTYLCTGALRYIIILSTYIQNTNVKARVYLIRIEIIKKVEAKGKCYVTQKLLYWRSKHDHSMTRIKILFYRF